MTATRSIETPVPESAHNRVFSPEHGYNEHRCSCGRTLKSDRGLTHHIVVEREHEEQYREYLRKDEYTANFVSQVHRVNAARNALTERDLWTLNDEGTWEEITTNGKGCLDVTEYVADMDSRRLLDEFVIDLLHRVAQVEPIR